MEELKNYLIKYMSTYKCDIDTALSHMVVKTYIAYKGFDDNEILKAREEIENADQEK